MDLNKDIPWLVNYCQKGPHSEKHAEKVSVYHAHQLYGRQRMMSVTHLFLYKEAINSVHIYRYCFPVNQFYVIPVHKIQKNNHNICWP